MILFSRNYREAAKEAVCLEWHCVISKRNFTRHIFSWDCLRKKWAHCCYSLAICCCCCRKQNHEPTQFSVVVVVVHSRRQVYDWYQFTCIGFVRFFIMRTWIGQQKFNTEKAKQFHIKHMWFVPWSKLLYTVRTNNEQIHTVSENLS